MSIELRHIPILTYHKITAEYEFGLNTVSPRQFYCQMQYLNQQGFTPITFHNILTPPLPDKPIIITFDDGYASVYEQALPILERFQFRAVIFIITGYLGRENTWDANIGGKKFRHLNEDQLHSLIEKGMEIGSHGVTHRALTYLSPAEIREELSSSFQALSVLGDRDITAVAYPFGIQNPQIIAAARECGYHFGCINQWGAAATHHTFSLKRIPVYRTDSLTAFQHKLSAGMNHFLELIKLRMISWPAFLTPIYQKYKKKLYRKLNHP